MADHSGLDAIITLPALVTFKDGADAAYAASDHTHTQSDVTGAVWYGTCSTGASTQAKVVTCSGFPASALKAGTVIIVKFSNNQTYNGVPTLNVNGTGAVEVKYIGTTNAARYEWRGGEAVQFVHDGTYWTIVDAGRANTSYYGVTKLSSSLTSTSTDLAAAAGAVNSLASMLTGISVYSASATYAVGDRVRYSTGIYQCTTAITTAEAWDATHWTRLTDLLTMIDSKATNDHTHGSITNSGAITSDTAAASGDKLVIADSSDSSKLKRSGIALGSSTSTFLRNDGTWAEPSSGGVSYVTTTATLTANGWSSDSQTVSCSPVTASNDVIVAPAPASAADYAAAGIVCTAQGSGTLTFTCTTAPSSAITVNVLVLSGGQ